MPERIEDQLKQMLVDRMILKIKPEEIQEDQSLIDFYGLDSVCVLEIIVGVEEKFGVTVGDGDFDVRNFATIASIADYVRRRQATPETGSGGTPAPA